MNKNSKVVLKVDMRSPKKVVCILVGLDFEERLFHCEVLMLHLSVLIDTCFWNRVRLYLLLGERRLVPVSSGLSYGGNTLCDQEVLSRPEDPAASDSSFGWNKEPFWTT